MITDEQINLAKEQLFGNDADAYLEHNDCIKIAYQWFDAQKKLKTISHNCLRKTIIEGWGGRYVSWYDIAVAAHLHPEIKGKYPSFNISKRLVKPALRRLTDIPEAFTHQYTCSDKDYATFEQ